MANELKLRDNNLYQTGERLLFPNGDEFLERIDIDYVATLNDQWHRVVSTDVLDRIAWEYWDGKVEDPSKYWWVIAMVNNIENPLDLTEYIGKEILVPDIMNFILRK